MTQQTSWWSALLQRLGRMLRREPAHGHDSPVAQAARPVPTVALLAPPEAGEGDLTSLRLCLKRHALPAPHRSVWDAVASFSVTPGQATCPAFDDAPADDLPAAAIAEAHAFWQVHHTESGDRWVLHLVVLPAGRAHGATAGRKYRWHWSRLSQMPAKGTNA